jgi:hypothetical protein
MMVDHNCDGPLGARLRTLEVPVPGTLRARVIDSAPVPLSMVGSPRHALGVRRAGAGAIAVGMIGALNLGAAYFFPRYGTALADAPAIGAVSRPLLSGAGLDAADVATASDVATSGGHTLRLVAGYADGLQTVFFIQIDDQSLATAAPPSKADHYLVVGEATLRDQFGRAYQRSVAPSGDQRSVVFSPLVSPAAENGGRLTLHVGRLFNVGEGSTVAGDWTLHATLFPHAAHALALPASISLAGNTYTFTSLRSASVLEVKWTVTGPAVRQALDQWQAGRGGSRGGAEDPFMPQLVGSNVVSQAGWSIDPKTAVLSGTMTFLIKRPGEYQLRVGSPDLGFVDRTIVVPSN